MLKITPSVMERVPADTLGGAQAAATALGTIHGVGLGPGAQDLLSVRADRLVRGTRHVAYFRKAGRAGRARRIVEGMLRDDVVEFAMEYPVTTEIPLRDRPSAWSSRIRSRSSSVSAIALLIGVVDRQRGVAQGLQVCLDVGELPPG